MAIQQNEVFPYYRKTTQWLSDIYKYLKTQFNDTYVDELCQIRGYASEEQRNLIEDMQLGYCDVAVEELGNHAEELGFITKKGNFLLSNRFIIPVYDAGNNIVSLIGYYPDNRKYITLPTPYFSKQILFFNLYQAYKLSYEKYDGLVILVEGIFDCLSLSAIGLPAIATMGADVSQTKGEILKIFKRVIGIPDDDKVGRKSLNRYGAKGWKVPPNTVMIKFLGGTLEMGGQVLHCKDMDNFVSWYDAEDVKEILLSFRDSKEDIEIWRL